MLSELYSPPRITGMLQKMQGCGLEPGFALDLTCVDPDDGLPWNFNNEAKREKARKLLDEQRPMFLVSGDISSSCWRCAGFRADQEDTLFMSILAVRCRGRRHHVAQQITWRRLSACRVAPSILGFQPRTSTPRTAGSFPQASTTAT